MLELSIVMATRDRRHLLERTFRTLLEQDFEPEKFEIVVVVDGAEDGTEEWLRSQKSACSLKVITQPRLGQAAGLNAAVRASQGDSVLFMDDDYICSASLVRAHADIHRSGETVFGFGPVRVAQESVPGLGTELARVQRDHYFDRFPGADESRGWLNTAGPNSSVPRRWLIECGGIDETLDRMLDGDLALRLMRLGLRGRYAPGALAWEIWTKGERVLSQREAPLCGREHLKLARRYPEHRKDCPFSRLSQGGFLKRTVRAAAIRRWDGSSAVLGLASSVARRCPTPGSRRIATWSFASRLSIRSFNTAMDECGGWNGFKSEFGRRLPVLLYHNVGPADRGEWRDLTVSLERFSRQMKWLAKHGYQGIRPSEWIAWIKNGKPLPEKPVLITFDDGYDTLAETAFPVLEQFGFGALTFLVSERIGGSNEWDVQQGYPRKRLLDRGSIRQWARRGLDFGSHSRTHRDLTALTDDELEGELRGSRDDLERLIEAPVSTFAYPYGIYDARVRSAAARAFDLAFIALSGMNGLWTDPHEMRRSSVKPFDTFVDIGFRARFGRNPIDRVRRLVGK